MVRLETKPPTPPTPQRRLRQLIIPVAIGTAVLVAVVILFRASTDTDDVGAERSASPANGARSAAPKDRRQAVMPATPDWTAPSAGAARPASAAATPSISGPATAPAGDPTGTAATPPTAHPARGVRRHRRGGSGGRAADSTTTEAAASEPGNRRDKGGPKIVTKTAPKTAPKTTPKTAPKGTQKVALAGAAGKHDAAEWQRPSSQEDPSSKLVARFAPTGGATLKGRVIDAETGKPPAGVAVEAHIGDSFMKTTTDGAGVFRMSGMLPGRRITVWIIGRSDTFVAERLDVTSPGEGETTDAGVVRLLRGDELASHLEGWMGVFVNRRGQRNVVAAVSPWSPADRAGLEVGDILLSIAGRDVDGLGPRATGFLLRGPVGTRVGIAVQDRHGLVQRFQLERVLR